MKSLTPIAAFMVFLFSYSPNLLAQPTFEEQQAPVEFSCHFHATEYFGHPSLSNALPASSDYLDLIAKAQQLERQLIQTDLNNGHWAEGQAEVLIELAQLKQSMGDTAKARELYENALYNMRINGGVFTLDQIPIILNLMESYMSVDSDFVDQLGDRAIFLYEKAYPEDAQISELIVGYTKILELRRYAHFSQNKASSVHSTKADQLGGKISSILEVLSSSADPTVRRRLVGNTTFYTHYDDLGQLVETPEAGVDQVSTVTGPILIEVQSLLRSTESDNPAVYDRAKHLLDELHEVYDELPYVDRAALLDFYADYFLAQENIPETIASYERMLAIKVLRPDYQLRALRALGQLYEQQERWQESIDSYNCWRQLATQEDSRVFIGLTNGYRRLQENELAIHHLLQYLELLNQKGQLADENLYVVLKQMYFDIGNLAAAEEVSLTISTLFND